MLRTGGRLTIAGLVNPNADVTVDANLILRQWITVRGVHNWPFGEIVEETFSLSELDVAFRRASARSILRAAIVP
jgi:hypothetical protein